MAAILFDLDDTLVVEEPSAERLGCSAGESVMVGDSLVRDVAGARRAGLRTVWLNRSRRAPAMDGIVPDAEVADLRELTTTLPKRPYGRLRA